MFNDVADDITGSGVIPERDMANTQTNTQSYQISICITAINKSPMATS